MATSEREAARQAYERHCASLGYSPVAGWLLWEQAWLTALAKQDAAMTPCPQQDALERRIDDAIFALGELDAAAVLRDARERIESLTAELAQLKFAKSDQSLLLDCEAELARQKEASDGFFNQAMSNGQRAMEAEARADRLQAALDALTNKPVTL